VIIACVGLFFASTAVIVQGPPGGINFNVAKEPSVTVINDGTNPVSVAVRPDGITVGVSTVYGYTGSSEVFTFGNTGEVEAFIPSDNRGIERTPKRARRRSAGTRPR